MTQRVLHIALLGAGGLLGSEISRQSMAKGYRLSAARSSDVDARNENAVLDWLSDTRPDALIICAAQQGGLKLNIDSPADMLAENARIAIASVGAARQLGISRLLYCSSGAIYPTDAPMPFCEKYAGGGPIDESHFGYASAKLLGTRYCQSVRRQDGLDYTALLLTNMYGPGQSYDPARSNVVGALMERFHAAGMRGDASVEVWGTGSATRDLIYVGDAASIILDLAGQPGPDDGLINLASGREITIREIATTISEVVGFSGRIVFDPSKPEGARRRAIDVGRLLALGLQAKTSLHEGVARTFAAGLG